MLRRPTSPEPARAALRAPDGAKGHLLTVRVVAARLGVSTATVYKLCETGRLAHVRLGNAIRGNPVVLAAFIANGGF